MRSLFRWAVVVLPAVALALCSPPANIPASSWRLFAIFVGTILGLIFQPLPGGAVVLLGVSASALLGALPIDKALAGYADPIVWLVLAACCISRGMIKTGLGRRIAFFFIRTMGHRSLGLGYALLSTDMVLATVIPSNGARAGGIIFPIAKSVAEAYDSRPGPTAGRLGTFLMNLLYQSDVIICAMFLTGQASNVLIARFARQMTGIDLSYGRWALGAIVPGLVSLTLVPLLVYHVARPEVTQTPAAAGFAAAELQRMGPMSRPEKLMLLVFGLLAGLWMTSSLHGLNYSVVALLGIAILLLSGVLTWEDLITERGAWDVFIWYGGLVGLAEAMGATGLTTRFAETAAGFIAGWPWWGALTILLLVYFYSHYGFASITAHATAMFVPFLGVIVAAGAPAPLAVPLLAYCSNLMASLTHYGTTPGPIYFAAGYVRQASWWRLGLLASGVNLAVWTVVGLAWWRVLGFW